MHLQEPLRLVLSGVPRIGHSNNTHIYGNRCPENLPFFACLRSILEYLGEDLGYRLISTCDTTWRLDCTYTFLMAFSGCAFRLSWKPGWYNDNADIRFMPGDQAAPFWRALSAVGYRPEKGNPRYTGSEEGCREMILHSLREQRRPVIAFGVIGPPEACLVTGYDEGGDVLIGWNYFQYDPLYNKGVDFEPSGEYRMRAWFRESLELLILGAKKPVLPRAEANREALRWALRVMRASHTSAGRHNGIDTFSAWAAHLQVDEAFPPGSLEMLRQRFLVLDNLVGSVAEGRWYAAKFMEMVTESEPGLQDELLCAADCFEYEHDLMWQVWGLAGGSLRSDEETLRLADPQLRREVAWLVTRAREKETRAANCIASALKIITMPIRKARRFFNK